MSEALNWVAEIQKLGFAALLTLVIFGNFVGVWVWGKVHRERIAELRAEHESQIEDLEQRLARAEADGAQWKEMALGLLAPLETTMRNTRRQQVGTGAAKWKD